MTLDIECPNKEICEAGALIEEARIIADLPDERLQELGWEVGARAVINVAFNVLGELSDVERKEFENSLPNEGSRCSDCPLGRNAVLRLLTQETPDSSADLE